MSDRKVESINNIELHTTFGPSDNNRKIIKKKKSEDLGFDALFKSECSRLEKERK